MRPSDSPPIYSGLYCISSLETLIVCDFDMKIDSHCSSA